LRLIANIAEIGSIIAIKRKCIRMSQSTVAELLDQILFAAAARGLDQQQLAELAGLSAGTLSRLKNQRNASFASLSRLAAAVGLRLTLSPDDDYVVDVERGELF
jgi:transcriptional regulator with XRE-family HTH domain